MNKKIYDLLLISVHNDTLFLNNMGVVDYSLLLHIYSNKEKKINYIRMGIIDYIRKYTWDKQLEHYIKIFINRFVVPTIINPSAYKNRFEEAIKDYFICIYDDLDESSVTPSIPCIIIYPVESGEGQNPFVGRKIRELCGNRVRGLSQFYKIPIPLPTVEP